MVKSQVCMKARRRSQSVLKVLVVFAVLALTSLSSCSKNMTTKEKVPETETRSDNKNKSGQHITYLFEKRVAGKLVGTEKVKLEGSNPPTRMQILCQLTDTAEKNPSHASCKLRTVYPAKTSPWSDFNKKMSEYGSDYELHVKVRGDPAKYFIIEPDVAGTILNACWALGPGLPEVNAYVVVPSLGIKRRDLRVKTTNPGEYQSADIDSEKAFRYVFTVLPENIEVVAYIHAESGSLLLYEVAPTSLEVREVEAGME